MKTKEIIKNLQEIDPSGEMHVRAPGGGAISFFEEKPGCWDGAYSYLDENGIYVTTTKGSKIDMSSTYIDDIVDKYEGDMEKIRKMIKFDYTVYNKKQTREKVDEHWVSIEKSAKESRILNEKLTKDFTFEVLKMLKKGYRVIQLKEYEIGTYNVMWFIKDLKVFKEFMKKDFSHQINSREDNQIKLNQGSCGAVLKSELFTPIEKEDHVEWKLDF